MKIEVSKDFLNWCSKNDNKHQSIDKIDEYLQRVRRMTTDDELGVRTYATGGGVMEIRLACRGGHLRLYCDTVAAKRTPPVLRIAGIAQKGASRYSQYTDIVSARAIIDSPDTQWTEYLSDISDEMPLSMDFQRPTDTPPESDVTTNKHKKDKKVKKPRKEKPEKVQPEQTMKQQKSKGKKVPTKKTTKPNDKKTSTVAMLPIPKPFDPELAQIALRSLNLAPTPAAKLAEQIIRTKYRDYDENSAIRTVVTSDSKTEQTAAPNLTPNISGAENAPTVTHTSAVDPTLHTGIGVDASNAATEINEPATEPSVQNNASLDNAPDSEMTAEMTTTETAVPAPEKVLNVTDQPISDAENKHFVDYDSVQYNLEILEHEINIQNCKIAIANFNIERENSKIEKELLEIKKLQLMISKIQMSQAQK